MKMVRPLVEALFSRHVVLAGMRVHLPWGVKYRVGVAAGNIRVQRLIDVATRPGDIFVDVGAHIGYNTLYAASKVRSRGAVYALEPAPDNRAILESNIAANGLTNVTVLPFAAGADASEREFFLRGPASAVNSLTPDSFYAPVTSSIRVRVAPLDALIAGEPDVVKIDVEGAELDVLAGMRRILQLRGIRLIVEWHPVLQQAAGYPADALPRLLIEHGFSLRAARHLRPFTPFAVDPQGIRALCARLLRSRRPVDLLATR
jgi:FkbM family methyltransferase